MKAVCRLPLLRQPNKCRIGCILVALSLSSSRENTLVTDTLDHWTAPPQDRVVNPPLGVGKYFRKGKLSSPMKTYVRTPFLAVLPGPSHNLQPVVCVFFFWEGGILKVIVCAFGQLEKEKKVEKW